MTVAAPATTLDAQLLCACNWAYAIQGNGTVPASLPYSAASGLSQVQGFVGGPDNIDGALVGLNSQGVVLAFRGTLPPDSPNHWQTLLDWLNDVDVELASGENIPGRVHSGFLKALDDLWPAIFSAVTQLLGQSQKTNPLAPPKLFVTGHSKGGSMAHLAAARLATLGTATGANLVVRSFEGAHPGNSEFANTYAALVTDPVRYEFQDDFVPHVPPSLSLRQLPGFERFWKRTTASLDADVDYVSAGRLVFIDWDMKPQSASEALRAQRWVHILHDLFMGGLTDIADCHHITCGSGVMNYIGPGVCSKTP